MSGARPRLRFVNTATAVFVCAAVLFATQSLEVPVWVIGLSVAATPAVALLDMILWFRDRRRAPQGEWDDD